MTKTHGESRTSPLYGVWRGMRQRCEDPNRKDYFRYGGRGIFVCQEWNTSYEAFRAWAHENGYAQGLQIERVDNDGPYCPDNCIWTTPSINSRNRRSSVSAKAFGETKNLAEWAEDSRCVVIYRVLHGRIVEDGWEPEIALTKPSQRQTRTHSPDPNVTPLKRNQAHRLCVCGRYAKVALLSDNPTCEECLAQRKVS